MKSFILQIRKPPNGVAPRAGGRGLKSACCQKLVIKKTSPPAQGGVDGNNCDLDDYIMQLGRPPRRGAWIEISSSWEQIPNANVAPRAGGRGLKC